MADGLSLFERMSRLARERQSITMDLFHKLDDSAAIVRLPKGIHKQTAVYRRGKSLYVPHGGGYVRIVSRFGEQWGTSHPDVAVLEMSVSFVTGQHGAPEFRA